MKKDKNGTFLSEVTSSLDTAGGFLTKKRTAKTVYLTAFFLPFVLLGFMWAINGVQPFGNRMILAHDQWHQYYPFYLALREKLRSGGSMLYSWTNGMGTNYLSMFAYYLSSPLNFIGALLPDSLAMFWYTLCVLVRISCAGLFCTVFLKNISGKCSLTLAFFGLMYAFCAYIAGYYWNAIWLETVALMPLVVLGTIQLLRDGKFILYITMLALAIFCSYYIGLFVCIFVLLLFICYNIVKWDGFSGFFRRLGRIAGCTVIALGLTAVLTVPTYLGLQNTSSAVNKFPEGFKINIGQDNWLGVADATRQIVANLALFTIPTSMEGLPNIFCGVCTLVLGLMFFTRRQIPLREKLCCGGLLVFFIVSFISRQLDYIWHGFHFPNMLPYRFSFLFSFVLIYMAFRSYNLLDDVKPKHVMITACLLAVFLACAIMTNSKTSSALTAGVILVALALLFLLAGQKVTKNLIAVLLCFAMLAEACVCMGYGVSKVSTTDATVYPKASEDVETVVDKMNELEKGTVGLWRAEVTQSQTLNDNALNGFNGVSTFSSAAYSGVSTFMKTIGIAASAPGNRYCYLETTPFTNMLLGVKYLIDRDGKQVNTTWCDVAAQSGNVLLLRNNAWLPMGWAVSDDILNYDTEKHSTSDTVSNLNAIYQQLSGNHDKLFEDVVPAGSDADTGATIKKSATYIYTVTKEEGASSTASGSVTYVMDRDGQFCAYISTRNTGNISVYINDEKLVSYSAKYGSIRYLGKLSEGDVVKISAAATTAGKDGTITTYGAMMNEEKFNALYNALSGKTMKTTLFTDTELEGTVEAEKDGVLFTTIPYDKGWTAVVDGREVSTISACGAFIAIRLTAGEHTVSFSYEPQGYRAGLVISLICLAAFLILITVYILRRILYTPMRKVTIPMLGFDPETDSRPAAASAELPAVPDNEPEHDNLEATQSTLSDETQIVTLEADKSISDILKRIPEDGKPEN